MNAKGNIDTLSGRECSIPFKMVLIPWFLNGVPYAKHLFDNMSVFCMTIAKICFGYLMKNMRLCLYIHAILSLALRVE